MKNHIQLKSITEENLSALWSISYGPKADLEWKKWDGPYFQDPILTWESITEGYLLSRKACRNRHCILGRWQSASMA